MATNQRISPEGLNAAISDIISEYTQDIGKDVKEDVKATGKACLQMVQANIDAAGIGGRKYRRSFKDTTTKDTPWITTVEIHSPKHYRLTHLLENGHVKKTKNGKVLGVTRAFPHLAPAEKDASELLEKKVKMTIRG